MRKMHEMAFLKKKKITYKTMTLQCFKKHLENIVKTEALHCYIRNLEAGAFVGDCEVLPVFSEVSYRPLWLGLRSLILQDGLFPKKFHNARVTEVF